MIPIDEHIAHEIEQFELHAQIHGEADPMMAEKIASLEELKRIREVQVPEEPEFIKRLIQTVADTHALSISCSVHLLKAIVEYIDTLRDLLKRETARADYNGEQWAASAEAILVVNKRAEAAESKLADEEVAHKRLRQSWNELDIKLKAILKLGENPSEEMMEIYIALFVSEARFDGAKVFKAMFAKLVEQSKEKANG